MAAYLQKNEVEVKYTSLAINVPNNDIICLMYYLMCVSST